MEDFVNGTFASECTEETMGPKRDSLYVIVPIIFIYVVIFITGTVGNISTCVVISKNKSMHTATNYYLFSLAISDVLLLVSGLPQEIYLIYSRWPYVFGSAFCFLRGLFAETSANATVLTITAFTVERYLAICHPFLSHTMSKLSRAVKLILGIWLVAVAIGIPLALQVKMKGPADCEMCLFDEPIIEHSFELSTILFFVLPMTLITVLYILIGIKLKSSTMMKKRNVVNNSNMRVQNRSSKKVIKMLVAVVVAFFICWAPFHGQRLYAIYYSLPDDDEETYNLALKIYAVVTYISGILHYMSATINPILYNIMSVKFREAFKETFSRCCGFKSNRQERSYSVLSRSAQRGPDSTDSGRDDPSIHSQTTVTQKSSLDSYNGCHPPCKRLKPLSTLKDASIEEETPQIEDIEIVRNESPVYRKRKKIWRYFLCITGKNERRLYFTSPVKEPNILLELEKSPKKPQPSSPCDVSNSSLRDIENGALEDELTSYMKEVKRREFLT